MRKQVSLLLSLFLVFSVLPVKVNAESRVEEKIDGFEDAFVEASLKDVGAGASINIESEAGEEAELLCKTYGDLEYWIVGGASPHVEIIGCQSTATSVDIPTTIEGYPVSVINSGAFSSHKNLISITIPDSVYTIGQDAFSDCEGLTSITIPDSVKLVGQSAFSGCKNVTSFKISTNLTVIYDNTFFNCTSVKSITIPDSVTGIGYDAFAGCSSLTSITIPDSVTSIGDSAFKECSSLTSITIPNSVTSINYRTFYNCTSLSSITIPNSVTSIGEGAFYNCRSLTNITIPDNVTSIGASAFRGCSELTSITIPDSVTSFGTSVFYGCIGLKTTGSVDSKANIKLKGSGELKLDFSMFPSLTVVEIPNTFTSIGSYTFYECSSLTSVMIPNSVTSIGEYAFARCTSLTSVTISDSVTSIGNYAFRECGNLTSITIPVNVTNIGDYAFNKCSNLKTISIKGKETATRSRTFGDCLNLSDVYFYDDAPDINSITFSSNMSFFAYYPENNPTWTEDKLQNYGAKSITWISWNPEDEEEQIQIIAPSYLCMRVGEEMQYPYRLLPETFDFSAVKITFESTDVLGEESPILSIDETGKIKAVNEGSAFITIDLPDYPIESYKTNVVVTSATEDDSFFVIGRDTNLFVHREMNVSGEIPNGFIGETYPVSSVHFAGLMQLALMEEEKIDKLLEEMNREYDGACEGIAITQALAYKDLLDISKYKVNNEKEYPQCYSDLDSPRNDSNLLSVLNYYYLLQFTYAKLTEKDIVKFDHFFGTNKKNKEKFFTGLAEYVKEEATKKNPVLFRFGWNKYKDNKKNGQSGHTVLIVGLEETQEVYRFKIYDCNLIYNYCYLDVNKNTFDLEYYYLDNDRNKQSKCDQMENGKSIPLNDNWISFGYYSTSIWDEFDTDLNNAELLSASDTPMAELYITSNCPFEIKTAEGSTLKYSDGEWSGDLEPQDLDYVGEENAQMYFTIPESDAYIMSGIEDSIDFDIVASDCFYSIESEGASEIYIHKNKGIEFLGDNISYNVGVGTDNEEKPSVIHVSGTGSNKVDILDQENQISVYTDDKESEAKIWVIDENGVSDEETVPMDEGIVIDDSGNVIEEPEESSHTIHQFSEPEFIWNNDNTCIARITCSEDGYIEEYPCTVEEIVVDGNTVLKATVTIYGKEYSNIKGSESEKPSVQLNKTELTLRVGKNETLIATVIPEGTKLTWSSSDTSVATVDQNGKVTAVADTGIGTPAQAEITATVNGSVSAKCIVTVEDPINGFVRRLYKLCFNRTADPGGFRQWTNGLRTKKNSAAATVRFFFTSQEFKNLKLNDEDFVEMCYQVMMDRASDAGGKKNWVSKLDIGMSQTYVLRGFIASREFSKICADYGITVGSINLTEPRDQNQGITEFVSRCYSEVLGRKADTGGLNDWCNRILTASSRKQAAINAASNGFFHSEEYMNKHTTNDQYVRTLYRTFLGREADTGGYNDWMNKLRTGTSRDIVMKGFANSTEFANIMAKYGIK